MIWTGLREYGWSGLALYLEKGVWMLQNGGGWDQWGYWCQPVAPLEMTGKVYAGSDAIAMAILR